MAQKVITINHLSKQFFLDSNGQYNTLRDLISEAPRRLWEQWWPKMKRVKFWALRNVSFEIKKGEVMGIIGRNGAGKSTLLKILARIVPPTEGTIEIRGKIASMLEVGTGFHTELTGRENIYLNGAILGMKRVEIKRKFNDIVNFSGIGKFLDMPVKRYSSGMHVRLAFSVAAHLDPEILLIDEVLAVGDMDFQRKSLRKMQSIAKDEGRTVIFVSHNMTAIDSLCDRVTLLEEGKLVAIGKPRDVISKYITDFVPDNTPKVGENKVRSGTGKVKILDFWIEDADHKRTSFVKSGDRCFFVFKYLCPSGYSQEKVDVGFGVSSSMEQPLFIHYMSFTKQELTKCPPKGKFIFEFPKLPLAKGQYKINARVTVRGVEADYVVGVALFNVEDGDFYHTGVLTGQNHSPTYVDGHWQLDK